MSDSIQGAGLRHGSHTHRHHATLLRHLERGRFDEFQALLADDVTFQGPLGTADDAAGCRAGIEGMSKITTDIVVHTIAADGENVVTMFDLHITETDEPVLVANWAQVGDDSKVMRIRVTFDPRPMLS